MWEEVLELMGSKWGLLGLGAVLLFSGGGRKVVRRAAKGVVKAGLTVSDAAREFVAEVKEQGSDLIAEVEAERKESLQDAKPAAKSENHSEKKAKKAAE